MWRFYFYYRNNWILRTFLTFSPISAPTSTFIPPTDYLLITIIIICSLIGFWFFVSIINVLFISAIFIINNKVAITSDDNNRDRDIEMAKLSFIKVSSPSFAHEIIKSAPPLEILYINYKRMLI